MAVYTYRNQLTVVECCKCHMDFAMSEMFNKDLRRTHNTFYCPAGHPQGYYGKSDIELERERADKAEARAAARLAALDREQAAHQSTERRRRAAVGQVTKIKRRVGRGVCPCCNRSFPNVAAHMESEHPDFIE